MQSVPRLPGCFPTVDFSSGGNEKNIFLLCIHRGHPRKESFGESQGRSGIPRPHKDPLCVASGALATSLVSGLWPLAGRGIAATSR